MHTGNNHGYFFMMFKMFIFKSLVLNGRKRRVFTEHTRTGPRQCRLFRAACAVVGQAQTAPRLQEILVQSNLSKVQEISFSKSLKFPNSGRELIDTHFAIWFINLNLIGVLKKCDKIDYFVFIETCLMQNKKKINYKYTYMFTEKKKVTFVNVPFVYYIKIFCLLFCL